MRIFSIVFFIFYSSVEHQIADLKQRLVHLEQQSIEHQTAFKNFDDNLRLFQTNFQTLQQSIEKRLVDLSVEEIHQIDVSLDLS